MQTQNWFKKHSLVVLTLYVTLSNVTEGQNALEKFEIVEA